VPRILSHIKVHRLSDYDNDNDYGNGNGNGNEWVCV
jgi:hypothetical protein